MPLLTLSRVSVLALSTFLVALAGCSSAGNDAAAEVEDDGIAEDDADLTGGRLTGTYRIDETLDPEGMGIFTWIDTLALKSDGTFYADEQGIGFDQDGFNPSQGHFEMRGKYTLKKSSDGSKKWISFSYPVPDGRTVTSKYFYKTGAGGIRLHLDIRGAEPDDNFLLMKLDRVNAWCAEAADCKLQSLPQPRCPGEWKCSKIRPDQTLTYTIDVCRYAMRCGG